MTFDLESVARSAMTQLELPGARLVVAVSGGADSMALAHSLAALRRDLTLDLHLAHLDHQLRPSSADDARFVRDFARELGLPIRLGSADVRALAAERGLGLEEAARHARYRFLGHAGREVGATAVAVGHTADDQAETRLLHLVRGCGLGGLVGMAMDGLVEVPEAPPVRVVRPLLSLPRSATEAYCEEREVRFRRDESNDDLAFVRNRLRANVLPELREINPRVHEALERLAARAAEAEEFLDAELDRQIRASCTIAAGGWRIDRRAWRALPVPLKRALLRRAAREVAGERFDRLDAAAIERGVYAADVWAAGRCLEWPGGLRLQIEHATLEISAAPRESNAPVPALPLPLEGRLTLRLRPAVQQGFEPRPSPSSVELRARRQEGTCLTRSPWHADLDLERVSNAPIVVRGRQPGDWLAPEGMTGRKKLQDVLVDAHVPRRERDGVRVVAIGPDIAWVVGLRRDRRFLAHAGSRDVLCLTVIWDIGGDVISKEESGDRPRQSHAG